MNLRLISTRREQQIVAALPSWLVEKVPRDHREAAAAFSRRRKVVTGVSLAGAGLLGLSLSRPPDSPQFYAATLAVAGTWLVGGFAAGPLHLGWMQGPDRTLRRPVITPVLTGGYAFAAFYGAALLVRHVPVLNDALRTILRFAAEGTTPLVYLTTLANGAAEEVFFRGALYAAIGEQYSVAGSTVVYTLATAATGNPALVLAGSVMGTLFALQRRASGGIQAPLLTHVTWAALMLRYLPPLFPSRPE